MKYDFRLSGVCPSSLHFELDGDVVSNVSFRGGCNGNLKAVSKLVEGMKVSEVSDILLGNTCGSKKTSCADQLARKLNEALESRDA